MFRVKLPARNSTLAGFVLKGLSGCAGSALFLRPLSGKMAKAALCAT